jgi:hypothetical protein
MCDSREAAVEADVSVAVSVAGRRSHLELLFCIRKHGLVWRRFEEAFGYVGCDATMPTLQVSVGLDDVSHLYGGQRSARVALDLFDEYGVVDPKRQLGSTTHKRRVDGGEATTALAYVDAADTLVFKFGRLSGPVVEARHAVSYNVDSTMRISVPLGSVAWVPPQCPRRLRVHASVCLELRGSPLAIAREVWGLRSAALWASVHLTRSVSWLTPEAKRQMRAKAGYELVEFQKLCLRIV